MGENRLNEAFRRFKDLADRKKVVYDEDLVALVDDEVVRDHARLRFVSLTVQAGSHGPATAELELEVDGDGAVRDGDRAGPGGRDVQRPADDLPA